MSPAEFASKHGVSAYIAICNPPEKSTFSDAVSVLNDLFMLRRSQQHERKYENTFLTLALVSFLAVFSQVAQAKDCLKGAAVGGVAGHVVGEHGLLGAAAGCVVGRHQANKKAKQEAAQSV